MDDEVYTLKEASDYMKMENTETLRRMAINEEIPATQMGNRWRFKKSDLDKLFVKKGEADA